MTSLVQASYAAGEISPELHGRVDQALYYIGLARAENMVVQSSGGIYNRSGLRYIGNIKNHAEGARLISFKFSAEDTYILEFGHKYIRFIRNDAHVTEGGKTITSINRGSSTVVISAGHGYSTGDDVYISGVVGMKEINQRWFRVVRTSANQFRLQSQVEGTNINSSGYSGYSSGGKSYKIYEISTPYEFDDLSKIKYSQSADVVTFVHSDYSTYQLKRKGHLDWVFEKLAFSSSAVIPINIRWGPKTYVNNPFGNAITVEFVVTAVDGVGEESIPGLLGLGYNITNIVVQPGASILVTYNDTRVILSDTIRGGPNYVANGDASALPDRPLTGRAPSGQTDQAGGIWTGLKDGDAIEIYGLVGDLASLNGYRFIITNHSELANTFVLENTGVLDGDVYVSGGAIYSTVGRFGTSSGDATMGVYLVSQIGVSSYRVYMKLPGQVEFGFAYYLNTEDASSSNGVLSNSATGLYLSNFVIPATSKKDNESTRNPPGYVDIFSQENEYPSVVGFFQQRAIFGSTKNKPENLYYSAVGDYINFYLNRVKVILNDDDPIVTTLSSGEVNNIRHLVGLSDLLVLTDSSQWQVRPSVGLGLSARTIEQRPQARVGSSHLTPVIFDDTVIYIREGNKEVVGLGYSKDQEGYVPLELSLLSNHMFETTPIIGIAAIYVPRKRLFCVRSDGETACLTFVPSQKLLAWTRWNTDGQFEGVATARPNLTALDANDEAYFVVRRIIEGTTVRYIERTDSRQFKDIRDCYFVDAGLTYDNPIEITDVALGMATTITTSENHGLEVGYEINFSDIEWIDKYDEFFTKLPLDDQLNNLKYKVKSVPSSKTFTIGNFDDISNIDSSDFTQYLEGGKVRSMVQTLRGLWYLEGKEVVILGDGEVLEPMIVSGGKVVLPYRYGRIQIGLRYISEIETLSLGLEEAAAQTVSKSLIDVVVSLYRSRGLLLAPVGGSFYDLPMRTTERWGEATKLFTGKVTIPMTSQWGNDGAFILRQKDPLPMGILSTLPSFDTSDPK